MNNSNNESVSNGKRSKKQKKTTTGTIMKIHPMWMQTAVRTGRLSCRKPNMQQIPNSGELKNEMRSAFASSSKQCCFVSCDYSQNEVQILAHVSEDKALISLFQDKSDVDIYKQMASLVTGQNVDKITKQQRSMFKQVTLAILYGMGVSQVAQKLGIQKHTAQQLIHSFYSRFFRVKQWINETISFAKCHKYVKTMCGRKRYLDDIDSSDSMKAEEMADIDDLASIAAGSEANVAPDNPPRVFLDFAKCIGIGEIDAHEEITKLVDAQNSTEGQNSRNDYVDSAHMNENKDESQKQKDITVEAFQKFCKNHLIDSNGFRHVVIKFMLHRRQFERELSMRSKLELPVVDWPIVPILDDYNVDRIEEVKQKKYSNDVIENILQGHLSGHMVNSKDELYLLDIQEKNTSIHNFSLYKYAVVMPGADKNFCDIFYHEDIGILQIREYMKQ